MADRPAMRWRPDRVDSLWIGLVGLLLGALTAVATAWIREENNPLDRWLAAAAAGLLSAGVASVVTTWLRSRIAKRDARGKVLDETVRGASNSIAEIPMNHLGIHAAIRDSTAFVVRDRFEEACAILKAQKHLLVTGPSMSGKSRLSYEAAKVSLANWRVIVPESGASLQTLLKAGAQPNQSIIWLDDVERFIDTGFTILQMEALSSRRNIVIATIRSAERSRYQTTSDVKPLGHDILEQFKAIDIEPRLSQTEIRRMATTVYADLIDEVSTYGLAEYLGGAHVAWDRYVDGQTVNPVGWALVRSAACWRYATGEAISESALKSLTPSYLPHWRKGQSIDFEDGLRWASKYVNETVCLLAPVARSSWLIFDYLLDRLVRSQEVSLDPVWPVVVRQKDIGGPAAFVAAIRATQHNKRGAAEVLWQRVIDSESRDLAAAAALNQGVAKIARGKRSDGIAALQLAVDLAEMDQDLRAAAYLELGRAYAADDKSAAKTYFLKAAAVQSADASPVALAYVGVIEKETGNDVDADRLFRSALSSLTSLNGRSSVQLGMIFHRAQMFDESEMAFDRALRSEDPEVASWAALKLGHCRHERGEYESASAAFKKAMDSGDSELAPAANLNLALSQERRGNVTAAVASLRDIAATSREEFGDSARVELGRILIEQQKWTEAIQFLAAPMPSLDKSAAAQAAFHLGVAQQQSGMDPTAAYLESIQNSRNRSSRAKFNLAIWYNENSDTRSAMRLFGECAKQGDSEVAFTALLAQARILRERGDTPQAISKYNAILRTGPKADATAAAFDLARIREEQDRDSEAARMYALAVSLGSMPDAAMAAVNLGSLRHEHGDNSGAEQVYRWAMSGSDPEQAAFAQLNLAILLESLGRVDEAEQLLKATIDDKRYIRGRASLVLQDLLRKHRKGSIRRQLRIARLAMIAAMSNEDFVRERMNRTLLASPMTRWIVD